jgi:hypothetical protein
MWVAATSNDQRSTAAATRPRAARNSASSAAGRSASVTGHSRAGGAGAAVAGGAGCAGAACAAEGACAVEGPRDCECRGVRAKRGAASAHLLGPDGGARRRFAPRGRCRRARRRLRHVSVHNRAPTLRCGRQPPRGPGSRGISRGIVSP